MALELPLRDWLTVNDWDALCDWLAELLDDCSPLGDMVKLGVRERVPLADAEPLWLVDIEMLGVWV